MGRTFGNPLGLLGPEADETTLRICEVVGVDPNMTTRISLEFEEGVGAVAKWEGIKRLKIEEVTAAIIGVPLSSWEHPADDDAGPAGPDDLNRQ